MPTYEYRCRTCAHRFEIQQAISDDPLTECPECSGELRKVFHPVGIAFKGEGFYRNDARSDGSARSRSSSNGSSASNGATSDSGSESGDGASDAKAADKGAPSAGSEGGSAGSEGGSAGSEGSTGATTTAGASSAG